MSENLLKHGGEKGGGSARTKRAQKAMTALKEKTSHNQKKRGERSPGAYIFKRGKK